MTAPVYTFVSYTIVDVKGFPFASKKNSSIDSRNIFAK